MAATCAIGRRRGRSGGFTLLEMMMVLALVGLLMALRSWRASAPFTKSELRGSTAKLAGAIRYLFDRASTTGQDPPAGVRLRGGQVLGRGVGRPLLHAPRAGDRGEPARRRPRTIAEEEEAEEGGARRGASSRRTRRMIDPSRYQPTEWKPKRARFETFKEKALKPVELQERQAGRAVHAPLRRSRCAPARATCTSSRWDRPSRRMVHLSDEDGETVLLAAGPPAERPGAGPQRLRRAPRRRAVRRRGQPDRGARAMSAASDEPSAAASRCSR